MEELVLDDPITNPPTVVAKYKVTSLILSFEAQITPLSSPGIVDIYLRDNLGNLFNHKYIEEEAIDLMKWLNTANFSVNSMHKRILQKLSSDGILPGTVTGTPDPAEDTNGE